MASNLMLYPLLVQRKANIKVAFNPSLFVERLKSGVEWPE